MVFQEPRLLPWRSVDDNVRLVAPEIAAGELASLFEVLGLAGHRAHYPGELSLGLARRVALARAFAVKPELLLLDEPFVSLDQPLAARLREELVVLVDRYAVITLLVTHDIDEAVALADRLILLSARPARILADMPIAMPRRSRTVADRAAIRTEVTDRLTALGQPAVVV
jgi:NitT/TauT family transport system ATP-binding protein